MLKIKHWISQPNDKLVHNLVQHRKEVWLIEVAHIRVFATMRTLSPVKAETFVLLPAEAPFLVTLALATVLVVAALVVAALVVAVLALATVLVVAALVVEAALVQPGSEGLHFKFESLVMFMLGMPLLMHATLWGTAPVKLPLIESQRTVSFLCVHVYPALATTVQS